MAQDNAVHSIEQQLFVVVMAMAEWHLSSHIEFRHTQFSSARSNLHSTYSLMKSLHETLISKTILTSTF